MSSEVTFFYSSFLSMGSADSAMKLLSVMLTTISCMIGDKT